MLAVLMAMSTVAEPPRMVTLPARARPAAAVRRTAKRPAKAKPVKRPIQVRALCLTGSCAPAVPSRYRLTEHQTSQWNGKLDVVKPAGMPCGVQGAPVCPKDGQQIVRTTID